MEELKQMIRVGFAEMHQEIAELKQDVAELKVRMTAVEKGLKELRSELHILVRGIQANLKDHETRLDALDGLG